MEGDGRFYGFWFQVCYKFALPLNTSHDFLLAPASTTGTYQTDLQHLMGAHHAHVKVGQFFISQGLPTAASSPPQASAENHSPERLQDSGQEASTRRRMHFPVSEARREAAQRNCRLRETDTHPQPAGPLKGPRTQHTRSACATWGPHTAAPAPPAVGRRPSRPPKKDMRETRRGVRGQVGCRRRLSPGHREEPRDRQHKR